MSQDYYKILEVDYDATDDAIRSNYIRLALVCVLVCYFNCCRNAILPIRHPVIRPRHCFVQKWHPDKKKDQDSATSRFQEINEAYQGDP